MRYVFAFPRTHKSNDAERLMSVLATLDDVEEFTIGAYGGWAEWALDVLREMFPLATARVLIGLDPRWHPTDPEVLVATADFAPDDWWAERQTLLDYGDVLVALTRETEYWRGAWGDSGTWNLILHAEALDFPAQVFHVGPESSEVAHKKRLAERRRKRKAKQSN